MATNNDDQYNFRTGSAEKKKDFQSRTKKLNEKNISSRDIYEAGLKVYEHGNTEQQIINRRNKAITERNAFFNLVCELNNKIVAFNRQLRNKNNRYKDYTDEKDVLFLYDDNGNELTTMDLTEEENQFKNNIETDLKLKNV